MIELILFLIAQIVSAPIDNEEKIKLLGQASELVIIVSEIKQQEILSNEPIQEHVKEQIKEPTPKVDPIDQTPERRQDLPRQYMPGFFIYDLDVEA